MKRLITIFLALSGALIPLPLLLKLVRLAPKLAHLLDNKGNFIFLEPETGIKYNVNCKSNIDRMLVRGDYAREFDPIFDKLLSPDSDCIDCGANIGAVALRMGLRLTGTAKVMAIEPGPPMFERLTSSFALNPNFSNRAILVQSGVGSKQSELFWNIDSANSGNANLLADQGFRVPVTTVDTLVNTREIRRVGFIKIDVEGMEGDVIKGARATIVRDRPVLYYEASINYPKRLGYSYIKEIEDFLYSIDYLVGHWKGGFIELRYPYSERLDLLAIPREKLKPNS